VKSIHVDPSKRFAVVVEFHADPSKRLPPAETKTFDELLAADDPSLLFA
jgi:hypothetical protein